jgi:hypothetical protein
MSLYLSEKEVAAEVLGLRRSLAEWRGTATILERRGFPKIDPLFGGRYMPAVRRWLDVYNRVEFIKPVHDQSQEKWPDRKAAKHRANGEPSKTDNAHRPGERDE